MQSLYGYLRSRWDQEYEKRPKQDFDDDPDTMELWKERERAAFFNRQKSVFDQEKQGLNRTDSVFDQTAVFHVNREN